jgi:hypothetical protein
LGLATGLAKADVVKSPGKGKAMVEKCMVKGAGCIVGFG